MSIKNETPQKVSAQVLVGEAAVRKTLTAPDAHLVAEGSLPPSPGIEPSPPARLEPAAMQEQRRLQHNLTQHSGEHLA